MKVLWFANTPANGAEVLKGYGVGGGWLSSLDCVLKSKVELTVAFYYSRFAEPFNYKGVRYFPICKKRWKLYIIRKNLFGDFIDNEDLPLYLDIIKKVQPDVIHIHGSENSFGSLMGVTDIPIVLSIQGICNVNTHKFFSGIEKQYATISGKSIWSPYSWIFNKSFYYHYRKTFTKFPKIEQRNLSKCKYIIGRTDWDKRVTRIIAPDSLYYHNEELLRDLFYKQKWENPKNRNCVVHSTTGNSFFKGFETICQSLNELNKIGSEIEWRVAGISEDSLINKVVKRKLKKDYPEKGLILLGGLNESELVAKMLEADIYVMPSHIENSSNSLCEAMILGMPCITTLAGGSSSLLRDKEEGLVIQDGDPWSMAGSILELYSNPEVSIKYGQNARKRALDRHCPEKIVNDLLFIYQQIIDKNNQLN